MSKPASATPARALFHGLDFTLAGGQWTCLLGPSGVGKSTLLRLIAGLVRPDRGAVRCSDGRPLAGRLAWMGQRDDLLPWLSARANVMLGARLRGEAAGPRAGRTSCSTASALTRQRDQRPATLSGGERQRAALARTLMEDRPVVLMDEPFSALDAITRARLQSLAAALLAGRTVLLVTHDPLEALRLGHRVHVMAGAACADRGADPACRASRRAICTIPDLMRLQGDLLARLADAQDAVAA